MSRYNQDTRHSNPSFSLSAFSIREQIQILTIKKPAHLGSKSPVRLALNSSFHPPPKNVLRSSGWASHHTEAFSMVAGGYKRTNITCRRAVKQVRFHLRLNSERPFNPIQLLHVRYRGRTATPTPKSVYLLSL
jgi:hypothetical protein